MKRPRNEAVREKLTTEPSMVRIGVTGHRGHRLRLSDGVLLRNVIDVLALVGRARKISSMGSIEVVSALAEGADEIVARAALETGCKLTVLLPFEPADYETTFSDPTYKRSFRKLLKHANFRIVLPGSLRRANEGYVAVGLETVNRSDLLVTIWDGAPAQGRGGTPEILQLALDKRRTIVWIDATEDRPPRLMQRSRFGPCPQLLNLAQRAPPLKLKRLTFL